MKRQTFVCAAIALMGAVAAPVSAQVLTFGASGPSGNYAAFLASLSGYGQTATTITFAGQSGTLNPNFYPGVTLTPTGDVNTIQNNAGPGQGNTTGAVPGEGPHAPSEYLLDGASSSTLTISFANQVFGAGLFIIDYFNPSGSNNPLNFYAWTGQNGTGSMLAGFSSVSQNFQRNNMYFMGVTSAAGNIGSIVFDDFSTSTGDVTGIDDITFSSATVTATPEPASILLMATGLAGLAMARRRRSM